MAGGTTPKKQILSVVPSQVPSSMSVVPKVPPSKMLASKGSDPEFVCMYGAQCGLTHSKRDDMLVGVILLYTNMPEVPQEVPLKLKANDPSTKPISTPAPCNRKEALASPWWQGYYEAEQAEMQSHEKNGTWKLIPRGDVPKGATVLRDRWAYSDKLAPNGNAIERFKARLTAMGCFQKPGVDYGETYASVMSTRTFRMLLQIYNSDKSHKMLHWDVSTAFIHAPLQERVYMKQASGHEVRGKETWVYQLIKALYGTKQAARAWQQHLAKQLVKRGCMR